jgi:hypothetical protein
MDRPSTRLTHAPLLDEVNKQRGLARKKKSSGALPWRDWPNQYQLRRLQRRALLRVEKCTLASVAVRQADTQYKLFNRPSQPQQRKWRWFLEIAVNVRGCGGY